MGEKKKYKNPEYRRMYEILADRLGRNLGKSIFTILIFNVLISILLTTGISPTMALGKSAEGNFLSPAGFVLSILFLFIFLVLIFSIAYGIVTNFTNVVLGKKNFRSTFFYFLSEKSGRITRASILFSLVTSAVAAISVALVFFGKEKISSNVESFAAMIAGGENPGEENLEPLKFLAMAIFYSALFSLIFAFAFLPFIFVWSSFFEDKTIGLLSAVKKSFFVIRARYFHYFGFVIFSCFKNIVFIVFLSALNFILAQSNFGVVNFLSAVFGFLAFLQYYTILAKIYYCIPIYYYSFLSVNGLVSSK